MNGGKTFAGERFYEISVRIFHRALFDSLEKKINKAGCFCEWPSMNDDRKRCQKFCMNKKQTSCKEKENIKNRRSAASGKSNKKKKKPARGSFVECIFLFSSFLLCFLPSHTTTPSLRCHSKVCACVRTAPCRCVCELRGKVQARREEGVCECCEKRGNWPGRFSLTSSSSEK